MTSFTLSSCSLSAELPAEDIYIFSKIFLYLLKCPFCNLSNLMSFYETFRCCLLSSLYISKDCKLVMKPVRPIPPTGRITAFDDLHIET